MVAIESQFESERLKRIHNIAYEIVIIMNPGVISRLQSSERRNHYVVKPYASGYDSGGGSRFSDKWGGGGGSWGGGEGWSQKTFCSALRASVSSNIRGSRDPPLDPPLYSYSHSLSLAKLVRLKSGR